MIKPPLIFFTASLLVLALLGGFWFQLGKPHELPGITSASHKLQCVSYSPFASDQSPLQKGFVIRPAQIDMDLALLSRYFTCIRTYSMTGLDQLPLYARKHGLRMMAGAWISADERDTAQEIEKLVQAANAYPDVVQSVIVGNEALLRKEISASRLAGLIRSVKARVTQPVTYADVWEFWLRHLQLAPEVDFITIHLLPYWENDPAGIDDALQHVADVRARFGAGYPDKPVFIGETGWPSEGRQRETARPSRLNQAKFIRGFVMMAERNGWDYNLIEAFDQPWKRMNEGAVGGYWGLFDAGRNDKHILDGAVSNLPAWHYYAAWSAGIASLLLLLAGIPATARDALFMPALAAITGACLCLWLKQALSDNRDIGEWSWTFALALLNVLVVMRACLRQATAAAVRRRAAVTAFERHAGTLLLVWGFIAALMTLQLVFDARYRQFPSYVLLCPALVFLRWPVPTRHLRELRLLTAIVAAGIPLVIVQETWRNAQALGWAGATLLLALALWRSSRISRNAPSSNANAAIVTV